MKHIVERRPTFAAPWRKSAKRAQLGAAFLAAGLFVGAAHGQAAMPQPQMQGSVAYLNGGAGDEEVEFIRQSMKDYTLALGFARAGSPRAEYVASVSVTIKNAGGETVFEAPSVGPYLLVKLPPGNYTVVATYENQSRTRPVTAGRTASSIVTIEWN